jgi:hypothetical protein
MTKFPKSHGLGLIEWILIIVLVLMILVTIYLLLRPALGNFWQEFMQSIQ